MENLLKEIFRARVYDVAHRTPLDYAKNLSQKVKNHVHLKREDLQSVFSFKIRGAYNKIVQLNEVEKQKGVICASAGNHAQGVSLSAQKLNIPSTIIMPYTTPGIKIQAVESYGAKVELHGNNYSEAADYCKNRIQELSATYIHPFDDPLVIAGQGTIGHEIFQQCPEAEIIFIPIGGGGLIAGIATLLKELSPKTRIVGVEPTDSDAMIRSVQDKKHVCLQDVGIFADGVAVKKVGILTLELVRKYVDEIITVTTDEICSAIRLIYEDTRSIVEPAGALSVAGMKKYLENNPCENKHLVTINSGANMNFDRLSFVTERALLGDRKEAIFAITMKEKPGALKTFCKEIGDRNITEFNYRLTNREEASVVIGIELNGKKERELFSQLLTKHSIKHLDLTNNELAKTHVRHMIGGKPHNSIQERVYRFQFPERPGSLAHFLTEMSANWNISMFHYRSHGGEFGRVFMGFEFPTAEEKDFQDFLRRLNYWYIEETSNPVYEMFL